MTLAEPGPEQRARNRVLIAERLGWPDGALEITGELTDKYPGWVFFWCRDRQAFAASSRTSGMAGHVVYRQDVNDLREFAETTPELAWRSGWKPPEGWR